jgi:hypothetical protein
MGDIEDVRADNVGHVREDHGQTLGVVLLIDVLDVLATVPGLLGIADVIDIEAQALREVVEPVQLQLSVEVSCHWHPSLTH